MSHFFGLALLADQLINFGTQIRVGLCQISNDGCWGASCTVSLQNRIYASGETKSLNRPGQQRRLV